MAHLSTFFGGMHAVEITTAKMRDFAQARLAAGATPATVNRDLGVLSRMFTLASQASRLSRRPYFLRLPEAQPRQGFLERAAKGPRCSRRPSADCVVDHQEHNRSDDGNDQAIDI